MSVGRIKYLDILRGMGMLMVIYQHTALLPKDSVAGNALICLTYGAVPCFMLVSGGLMHQKRGLDWRKYILKLLKMYLLLAFWKAVYLIFYQNLYGLVFRRRDLACYLFLFASLPGVNAGLLWYIEAYLAVMLLYPVTWFLFQGGKNGRRILAFLGGILLAGNCFVIIKQECAYISLAQAQKVLPCLYYGNMCYYFIAGAFLLAQKEQIIGFLKHSKLRSLIPGVLIVLGVLGLMLIKFRDIGCFSWQQEHVENAYCRIPTILLSTGLYLSVMLGGECSKRLSCFFGDIIGKNTLGIFFLHGLVLPCFQICIGVYFADVKSFGLHLLVTAAVLLICILLVRLLAKIPVIRRVIQ